MAKKTARMKKEDIKSLPQNKPVVYKILNGGGENIYTGVEYAINGYWTFRGFVQEYPICHF